jgi:hypothetical protein
MTSSKARRAGAAIFSLVVLAAASVAIAELTPQKTALITIPATFEVQAPVAKVWTALTTVGGFSTLSGFTPADAEKSKVFAKTGDAFPAKMWTDSGTLIAARVVKEKELRVTWDPDGGHYLCGKRIVLSPTTNGTKVEYWDRYTDDQSNVYETAAVVAKETEKGIAAFRVLVEK